MAERPETCFYCGGELPDEPPYSLTDWRERETPDGTNVLIEWCSRDCMRNSIPGLTAPRCEACGLDLTPTVEQLQALHRFGNPLRRPPCLETADGQHVVSDEQLAENRAGGVGASREGAISVPGFDAGIEVGGSNHRPSREGDERG